MPTAAAPSVEAAPRRGVAVLTRLAYAGADLVPLYASLTRACRFEANGAGDVMDLALLAQLLGDPAGGLQLQSRILEVQRLYRPARGPEKPRLKLLCLAADMDIGSNTPVEFLVDGSDIEILTLYLRAGDPLPQPIPPHDAVMVIMPDDARCRGLLAMLGHALADWPKPVLNRPEAISRLDRDRLFTVLAGIPGLDVPETRRLLRNGALATREAFGGGPLVVRPVGSHAGRGLALVRSAAQLKDYLHLCTDDHVFMSPFVDYRSADGLYRKYRVVLIGGKPYPVHMALGTQWSLWYLNADMEKNVSRREEERAFMDGFATGFGQRHAACLAAAAQRIGLDYVGLDCAELPDGRLVIFEADNTLIVHDMDPPELFPYKPRHMRRLFAAFQAVVHKSRPS
jgi:glutathione synthase/RimK-type ligase-like ATP-grasp enzyme